METMGILVTRKEIVLDTLGARTGLAECARCFLSNNRGESVGTHHTELGLDDLVLETFGGFSRHDTLYLPLPDVSILCIDGTRWALRI